MCTGLTSEHVIAVEKDSVSIASSGPVGRSADGAMMTPAKCITFPPGAGSTLASSSNVLMQNIMNPRCSRSFASDAARGFELTFVMTRNSLRLPLGVLSALLRFFRGFCWDM